MTQAEAIGLEAVFETVEFLNGLKSYMSGLSTAEAQTDSAASSMERSLSKFDNSAKTATGSVANAFRGLGMLGMSLAVALGNILSGAVSKAIDWIFNLGKTGMESAARVQELDYVLQILAPRANTTVEALREQMEAIQDLGIQTDVAQNLIQQFIRYDLDLSKAAQLARVAQDTAVLSMKSSSAELNSILWGIQTYNSRILRTAGLNVNMAQAFKDYAEELHKTTAELTQTEKQQAALNAVLAEGARNYGMYEAAMEAPGKQLRSFQRDMYELGVTIASPFLPAFSNLITTARTLAKEWNSAIAAGGPLHPLLVNLGAVAALATGYFKNLVLNVSRAFIQILSGQSDWGNQFLANFNTIFSNTAQSALSWGQAIISFLAQGMAQAAELVVQVLIAIGELIASWLMPHSPPKILPDLEKWGAEAMTIYMNGWKNGDFSVFDQIATVVETYLKDLGKSNIEEQGLIPMILGGRGALTDAINQVRAAGQVTDTILSNLFAKLGPVSQAVKDYAASSLQLQLVSEQLVASQQELNSVNSYYDTILKSLNAQLQAESQSFDDNIRLKEIQDAIATGRLTDQEKEKLQREANQIMLREQIAATEQARDKDIAAAQAKVDAVAQQKAALEAQMASQKSLIDMQDKQNQLIQQQIDLLERLAKTKGGGGGGGGGPEMPEIGGGGMPGISDELAKEIEEARKKMELQIQVFMLKLQAAWQDFKTDFYIKFIYPIEQDIKKIGTAWEPVWQAALNAFNTYLKPSWDQFMTYMQTTVWPFLQDLAQWFKDNPETVMKIVGAVIALVGAFALLSPVIGALFGVIGSIITFFFQFGAAIVVVAINWNIITGLFATFTGVVLPVIGSFALIVAGIAALIAIIITAYLAWTNNWWGMRDTVQGVWDWIQANIFPVFENMWTWLATNIPQAIQWLSDTWNNTFMPVINAVWGFITTVVIPLFQYWFGMLYAEGVAAVNVISAVWNEVFMPIINFVWSFILNNVIPVIQTLANIIQVNLSTATMILVGYWEGVLQPAIANITTTFRDHLMPVINTLIDIVQRVLVLAFTAYVGFQEKIVIPAILLISNTIQTIWLGAIVAVRDYVNNFLGPIWQWLLDKIITPVTDYLAGQAKKAWDGLLTAATAVHDFVRDSIGPKFQWLLNNVIAPLRDTISAGLNGALDLLNKALSELKRLLDNIQLPWWLTPGSPTPFELGVRGATDAIKELDSITYSGLNFKNRLQLPSATSVYNTSTSSYYNRTVNVEMNPSYSNYQSPSNVYLDLQAALVSARI